MFVFRLIAPASAGLLCLFAVSAPAVSFQEDFASDPLSHGWEAFGAAELFQWNAENQNLEVTWDSSKTNSYFYHRLGTVLTRADDFTLSFELRLTQISVGTFELALGFLDIASATNVTFLRGTGPDSPNLVEFDYFPDWTSINATSCDSNSVMTFRYDARLPLSVGEIYHVELRHKAGESMASASVYTNGVLYTDLPDAFASAGFQDFNLDAMAVMNYNDKNSYGALLAKGVVDNLVVEMTSSPVNTISGAFAGAAWQVRSGSADGWSYTLQRSLDFQTWDTIQGPVPGTGGELQLNDPQPPVNGAFYRVKASQ